MRFTKMHGLGNDYVYLNCLSAVPPDLPALARAMSDRHLGVGADGLIAVVPGRQGDFTMAMYNADGSRGEMCGNGIRCLGKYVFDKGLTQKTALRIDTPAGLRTLRLHLGRGGVEQVTVDMGEPVLSPDLSVETAQQTYQGTPVSMGNPHFVVFCPDPEAIPLAQAGPALERHSLFPHRTNVEFVRTVQGVLHLRVWERGSGETMACGTGACAAFAAARRRGLCGDRTRVRLPGGVLSLHRDRSSGHFFMTGPAVTVFEGDWPDAFE